MTQTVQDLIIELSRFKPETVITPMVENTTVKVLYNKEDESSVYIVPIYDGEK